MIFGCAARSPKRERVGLRLFSLHTFGPVINSPASSSSLWKRESNREEPWGRQEPYIPRPSKIGLLSSDIALTDHLTGLWGFLCLTAVLHSSQTDPCSTVWDLCGEAVLRQKSHSGNMPGVSQDEDKVTEFLMTKKV